MNVAHPRISHSFFKDRKKNGVWFKFGKGFREKYVISHVGVRAHSSSGMNKVKVVSVEGKRKTTSYDARNKERNSETGTRTSQKLVKALGK